MEVRYHHCFMRLLYWWSYL